MKEWTQDKRYVRPTWFFGDLAVQYCEPPWCRKPEYRIWRRAKLNQWRSDDSVLGWWPGETYESLEEAIEKSLA